MILQTNLGSLSLIDSVFCINNLSQPVEFYLNAAQVRLNFLIRKGHITSYVPVNDMTRLKNTLHIPLILLLWQSCSSAQEITLTDVEKMVVRSGINDILKTNMSDYVLISSFADFSNLYTNDDKSELESAFENANEGAIPVTITRESFETTLMPRAEYDSLLNNLSTSRFWSHFRSHAGKGKAGLLEITKPAIVGDRAFFWFSHQEGSKSGAVVMVWLKQESTRWQLERVKERLEF